MNSNKDIIIGIECHIQLDTNSKLFCGCATKGNEQPNTRTCEVCLGMPGSKPVINIQAIYYALRLCIALNCKINPQLIFSRKSYFYPDMSKNYQITQYEEPLGSRGKIFLSSGKEIGITRVHLEEDPAALIHTGSMATSPFVLVDYNRSGNPLCEIVTEPELNSPEEARDFMKKLMTMLNYLGVFDPASGIIKADVNVSIKESGYIRSEIKNITGFKEIERALFYEVDRQKKAVEQNEKLLPDTRGWDAAKGMTYRMRVKEKEEDYGYIFEPDLVVTDITKDWVEAIKKEMPEMAEEKVRKFVKKHKIPEIDAQVLAAERVLAELFEKVAEEIDPVLAAKWLRRELVRVVNYTKQNLKDLLIDEQHMIELLSMVEKGQITETVAQKILEEMIVKPFSPKEYVRKHKLEAVSEVKVLEKYCKQAIKENPKAVQDAKAGKAPAINFLIGKVMAKTKGKATPKEVNEILRKLIG